MLPTPERCEAEIRRSHYACIGLDIKELFEDRELETGIRPNDFARLYRDRRGIIDL